MQRPRDPLTGMDSSARVLGVAGVLVADASLNTPQSVDQGRFIVELRVAPSLPMTILTIRLVQTSERSLAMEVR